MASIVGVREDKLAHSYDENTKTALVWETSEGGAGLSDIFADVLQKNPLQIYLEMVATIACPIFLAEQYPHLWTKQFELISYLAKQFNLPEIQPLLEEISEEALAERRYSDTSGLVCEKYDGCPACIQTTQSEADEQPKRSLAWQLVQSLIRRIPSVQLGETMSQTPCPVIWADTKQGYYYVLVF